MAKEDPSRAGQTLAANIDAEKKPRFWGGGVYFLKKKKKYGPVVSGGPPRVFRGLWLVPLSLPKVELIGPA